MDFHYRAQCHYRMTYPSLLQDPITTIKKAAALFPAPASKDQVMMKMGKTVEVRDHQNQSIS